jgi:hypothetical protein
LLRRQYLGYQQVDVANEKQFCNMPCTAASSETCGGSWYNSIHKTGVSAPAVPEPKYEGCYSDAANRALPVVLSQSGATRKSCVAAARPAACSTPACNTAGSALPATPSAIKRPNRPMKAQLAA